MSRNMFNRVEACFPIEKKQLKTRVLEDLAAYLKDNAGSWIMQSDGSYVKSIAEGEVYQVQTALMEQYSAN